MNQHRGVILFLLLLVAVPLCLSEVVAAPPAPSAPSMQSAPHESAYFLKTREERWGEYVGGSLVIRKTGKEACSVWMFPPGKNTNGWRLHSSGKEIVSAQWQGDMVVIVDRAKLMVVYRNFSRIRTGRAPK